MVIKKYIGGFYREISRGVFFFGRFSSYRDDTVRGAFTSLVADSRGGGRGR